MSIFKKIVLAATALLAYSLNIFSQTPEPEGVYVYTSVEDFNYETLSGKLKIESFVKDEVKNPVPPTPLDLVFVIDVSGSMGYDVIKYEYTEQTSASYSYSGYGSKQYYYKHTDGQYYQVQRGRKKGDDEDDPTYYWLYYTVGSTTYYLSGSAVSTKRPSIKNSTNTIWTGVLYQRTEENLGTRLSIVKQATKDFIDAIAETSSDEVDNKIALVKFSASGTIVRNLTSVLTGANTLKSDINNLAANGGTYTNLGLNKVLEIFTNAGTDDRQRVVILFTDGAPSATNNDGGAYVASEAINNSKTLKDRGATVYTVGILDNSNLTDITDKMMNYVSSKYPNASASYSSSTKKMTTTPGTSVEGEYFFNSPDGSAIPSIFAQIAEMVAPTKLILGEDTEVHNAFKASVKLDLPGGSTANIKAYTADCTGYDSSTKTYSFDTPTLLTGLTITPVTDPSTGAQSLETNGFDYSANWCGLDGSGNPHGQALILEIPFNYTPTPGNLNDKELDLNDKEAGMYKDGSKVASAKFMSSAVPFAELTISKAGLHKGESAIFEIVRGKLGTEIVDAPVNRIVLTGTADDGTTVSYTLHYLNPAATYIVSEHTDWSWTYNPQDAKDSVTGFVTKSQAMSDAPVGTNGGKSATLTFENTKYSTDKFPATSEAIAK